MGRFVGTVLIIFFIIQTIGAQNKSFNLNEEGVVGLKSLSIVGHDTIPAFQDAIRARPMRFNPLIQNARSIQPNDTILLDLFDNKHYKGVIEKIGHDKNGTSVLRARLGGQDQGYCLISTFGGKSFMTLDVTGKNESYLSRYDHRTNRYFLLQMDQAKQKKVDNSPSRIPPTDNQFEDDPSLQQNASPSKENSLVIDRQEAQSGMEVAATTQDIISVMIVYTPAAATWALDNETHINNTIGLLMAKSQLVLDNSNTFTTLELVHSAQVDYTELNTDVDLDKLTGTNDGKMDQVHAWRDTYGADMVLLLEDIDFTGGIAWLLNSSSGNPSYAFSLTRVQQASWTYTAIHEIGHNLGCDHHKLQNNGAGPGLYSYSAGWRWTGTEGTKYCSVMTYNDGGSFDDGISATLLPYFSDPGIQYQGIPVGDPTQADNARTIRQVKSVVASYRDKPTVTPCSLPLAAGLISGKSGVCHGIETYTVQSIPNATSYLWTLPSGASGTSTTNTIYVSYGMAAVSGFLTVKGINDCGEGIASTLPITVNPLPAQAGSITGNTNVCQGIETYTVQPIPSATSYLWTLPSGASGTSTTNTIYVSYGMAAVFGFLTVKGINDCGEGIASTLPITVNPMPAQAGSITGNTNVCQGIETYTVQSIPSATSYIWTLPSGATGTSFTNSITVTYGLAAVSGYLTVKGINDCGEGIATSLPITVNYLPAQAGSITGNSNVCQGTETYTVQSIPSATSYLWTLPSGATGTSFTNSITVTYGLAAVSGYLTVKGINDCGEGIASSLPITINPMPAQAGSITGTSNVCQGIETYTVQPITYATSYRWTLPSGATGTSFTNSITVSYSLAAVSGNLTVKGINDCGEGIASASPITINSLPAQAGFITGNSNVCQGTEFYTVQSIPNATSYLWTLPSGATGTSTTSTIYVSYGMVAVSGNLTVKGINDCGEGLASSLPITINPMPAQAGSITGNSNVCQGTETYTVQPIPNATSYLWTLPSGASGTSTTNTIYVFYGMTAVSGYLSVKGVNECGEGLASSLPITINYLPAEAGTITGISNVCQGSDPGIYTVQSIANATSYRWTLPSGATGTSFTNSITVSYSLAAGSGYLSVIGINDCGEGMAASLLLEVSPIPITPVVSITPRGLISDALMGNQWYDSKGLIPEAIYREFIPGSSGTYYVVVSSPGGCTSGASNSVSYIPTSLYPVVSATTFNLYPNPATHELTIERKGLADRTAFDILNARGQIVLSGTLVDKTILQISTLPPGLYVVRLKSGKTGEWLKFLKN